MAMLAQLVEEVQRSRPAQAAMDLIEAALARRTPEEQGAFWRAVDLYYLSRKHPGADGAEARNGAAASRAP